MRQRPKEKTVTIQAFMSSMAFRVGVTEISMGLPMKGELFDTTSRYQYEAGRQFAVATGQRQVRMVKGRVEPEQQRSFEKLLKERTILL